MTKLYTLLFDKGRECQVAWQN